MTHMHCIFVGCARRPDSTAFLEDGGALLHADSTMFVFCYLFEDPVDGLSIIRHAVTGSGSAEYLQT